VQESIHVSNLSHISWIISHNLSRYFILICLFTVGTIDQVASETLAKVEEKFPIITKTPTEVSNS
jgi:hypothetical protein